MNNNTAVYNSETVINKLKSIGYSVFNLGGKQIIVTLKNRRVSYQELDFDRAQYELKFVIRSRCGNGYVISC
jgi:hypothetical protein